MGGNFIVGRKWIKLWVDPWLNGTTRFEMTDVQRAFWIDLLAMAGVSRSPGVVFAGMSADRPVGYPASKFAGLVSSPMNVEETFDLFERAGKIKIQVTSESPRLYMVTILNWNKYQSEYSRQKQYRQKSHKPQEETGGLQRELQPKLQRELHGALQQKYKKGNATEVEVEVEVEENLKTKTLVQHTPLDASDSPSNFDVFWNAYPRKEQKGEARKAFARLENLNGHFADVLSALEVWKRSVQWQTPQYIPLPKNWIANRQWEDRPAAIATVGDARVGEFHPELANVPPRTLENMGRPPAGFDWEEIRGDGTSVITGYLVCAKCKAVVGGNPTAAKHHTKHGKCAKGKV